MSWQAYIDTSLVGTGHLDKGSILSVAGDSEWAASPDFKLKPEEMKVLADILNGNEAAKDKAFGDGLFICGTRYVLAKVDDSIYARAGKDGLVAAKSEKAIVVGHHGETGIAGNATATVVSLADYLKKSGY